MAKDVKYYAPKRRIERVGSAINHAITNSITVSKIHTCEDSKTLVRTIIQLQIIPTGVTCTHNLVLYRLPRDNSVGNPSVSEGLDVDYIKEILWSYTGGFTNVDGGSREPVTVNVDLKSMRKLDPGDVLCLKDISDIVDSQRVVGVVTQFFKE